SAHTKDILGGASATLCAPRGRSIGSGLVVEGLDLTPLWKFLEIVPQESSLPLWELYPRLNTGVLKLADCCPFRCTYCSVPQFYPQFHARPVHRSFAELESLIRCGAEQLVFCVDAVLFKAD